MIDLAKKVLPSAVEADGFFYAVKTDFHYWIRFSQMVKEKHIPVDFDFLYDGKIPPDRMKGIDALTAFCYPHRELPRVLQESGNDDTICYDYAVDSDLIFSAFIQQYGINLIESSMHWYEFRALFDGLQGTKFNEVVKYRLWQRPPGKLSEYDRYMQRMQESWRIVPDATEEERKVMNNFESRLKPDLRG